MRANPSHGKLLSILGPNFYQPGCNIFRLLPWANFARSLLGKGRDGAAGIRYQMDVMDRHGVTGVFYVDPMPAILWGVESIAAFLEPIVARGHDVQLHLHPEWSQLAENPIVPYRSKMIGDYPLEEQIALIGQAKAWLLVTVRPRLHPCPMASRSGR